MWLVALPWAKKPKHITENIITRGWADPQNRGSLTESAPLVPGEFVDLEFDLQPDDQVLPAGTQIGLMLFASDADFTLWPKAGTQLSFDHSATRLALPLVGGTQAAQKALGE